MSEQITTQPEPAQGSQLSDTQTQETDRKDWHRRIEDFKRDYAPTPIILPPMPDEWKPRTLEQEIWVEVMYMLCMKEVEAQIKEAEAKVQETEAQMKEAEAKAKEAMIEERIDMIFNVLQHRYEDTAPVDEWQPLLAQCSPEQLKRFVDRAWQVNSLETFGDELAMISVDKQPITEQSSDESSG